MTTSAEERLEQFFLLLDSDQRGEREAALEKIVALVVAEGWTKTFFGNLFRSLKDTAPRAEFDMLKVEIGKWQAAHDALAKLNGALNKELAAFRERRQFLAHVRQGVLAAVGGVAALGLLGYGIASWASGDRQQAAQQAAAVDAGMRDIVRKAIWGTTDSKPVVIEVAGTPYWILLHTEADPASHLAADGKPVPRRCMHLFAVKAAPDAGSYLTPPEQKDWLSHFAWPEVAQECRDVNLFQHLDLLLGKPPS